uniref:Tubulin-folding cofactor B n=1 Tax=Tetraselmis sp. GSL018 TaxID=582737 RepID=A0A061S2S3_9CHLO
MISEIQELRDYVLADTGFQRKAESSVLLEVTHSNLRTKFMQIRLDLHMTVAAVKHKLMTHCGTSPSAMLIQLKDDTGKAICSLEDDSRKLGFYSPYDGCTLHVVDTDPTSLSAQGWLEDTSKVEKYVMSDEAYDRRSGTFRKYKEERRREDPSWTLHRELAQRRGGGSQDAGPEHMAAEASGVGVGDRCEVFPGGKRGEVKYVGKIGSLPPGFWVGVQLDEPVGKNDGSAKGERLFECPPNHGVFVRPDRVTVGEFPPLDDLDGLESDGEEI